MDATELLLADLRKRGFLVRAKGRGLQIVPFAKLTTADHRALKVHTPALMRLLSGESPPLSTAEAEVSNRDTVIASPPEQAAEPATQATTDEPPESEGEVKAAAPLRVPAPSSDLAAAVASDLPAFRDHIRSRRAALAGFMEQGALLAFENHTLTVVPRNDIYVRYLADNRQMIGELATEFFGCAVKVELAGAAPHPAVVDEE